MDERKKRIKELEQQKKEQAAFLDSLLADFGQTLFGRMEDSPQEDIGELAAYRRCKDDIAASQASIQTVDEQIRTFRELEEGIEAGDRDESACLRELAVLYAGLGKLLLNADADGAGYAEFCAPWREQAEALLIKIDSLENRIDGLEQKEGGNVFTWIGKGAQGLVLRSFLTKAQENLEQLRRNVGERYSDRYSGRLLDSGAQDAGFAEAGAEITELCAGAEAKRAELRGFTLNLEKLREEKRAISGSFSAEGSPLKQIQSLKNNIVRNEDELKALYRCIGAEATASERRESVASLVRLEDQETLDSAARAGTSIREAETAIEKLKASLAIDDEKAKIEKYLRMISDRKDRIAQAEKSIAEFEAGIRNSESIIERLKNLL
jgi:hypothetical protein